MEDESMTQLVKGVFQALLKISYMEVLGKITKEKALADVKFIQDAVNRDSPFGNLGFRMDHHYDNMREISLQLKEYTKNFDDKVNEQHFVNFVELNKDLINSIANTMADEFEEIRKRFYNNIQ
jgi:hypothetical protein